MLRPILTLALISTLAFLPMACKKEGAAPPAPDAPKGLVAPAAAPEVPAASAEKPAMPAAPAATGIPAEKEEVAVPEEVKKVEEAAAEIKEKVETTVADAEAMADPSVSVEKVKESVSTLSSENLTALANKLVAAIQGQEGAAAALKEEISKLGILDGLKGAELKQKLDSAIAGIPGLKEKLGVVVEKMKGSGLDVSKYTSLVGG